MDRAQALAQLPRSYSVALRLHAAGVTTGLIGECLQVEPEVVSTLLDLAQAKLEAMTAERD